MIYNINRVILGLTTSPSRISKIYPTLKSIINQSYPADRIILSLPDEMARTGEIFKIIPQEILDLVEQRKLEIHNTKDYGPATKYVGLLEVENDEEAFLIWCDDDMEYNSEMIRSLLSQLAKYPKSAMGMCAFNMTENPEKFEVIDENAKEAEILEGFCGVICRRKDMPNIQNWKPVNHLQFKSMSLQDKAYFLGDDYVINHLLREKGTKTLACTTSYYNRLNGLKIRDINFGQDALRTNKYTKSNMLSYRIIKRFLLLKDQGLKK